MIIELGWTREYIDDVTDLPLINSLMREWGRAPPVRITVAQALGYKPPAPQMPATDLPQSFDLPFED